MGDLDWNQVIVLVITALTVYNSYLIYKTKMAVQTTSEAIRRTDDNVMLIEKATNSMKDALVASTAKASYAEGAGKERERGEHKAAVLAAGQSHVGEVAPVAIVGSIPVDVTQSVPIEIKKESEQ